MNVIHVKPKANYRLNLTLASGKRVDFDCTPWLKHVKAKPLQDPEVFSQVKVDAFGGVYWPNGFDIAPEVLTGSS